GKLSGFAGLKGSFQLPAVGMGVFFVAASPEVSCCCLPGTLVWAPRTKVRWCPDTANSSCEIAVSWPGIRPDPW
ncbi:MAG: hypothetical protein ACK5A1_22845, partial [Planctomyces sp.]